MVHVPSDLIAALYPERGGSLLGDKAWSVVFDNTKIRRFVPAYRPRVSFAEGMARSVAWFDARPGPPRGERGERPPDRSRHRRPAARARGLAPIGRQRGVRGGTESTISSPAIVSSGCFATTRYSYSTPGSRPLTSAEKRPGDDRLAKGVSIQGSSAV